MASEDEEATTEWKDDVSDEEFVDAQDELGPTSEVGDDDGSSFTEPGLIGKEHRGEDMDLDEEEDLFASTFGNKRSHESSDEDEDQPPLKRRFVATEHTKGCNSSPGPSTPPPEAAAPASPRYGEFRPLNPHKERSWNLRRLSRFYLRAKELIPRLPLASHRYWIGVLDVKNSMDNFKKEKDFVWMKGNRKITVETIWHMYQQSTAEDKFVLLLGNERVDFKDNVEQLDYFGDKKVIFRAVRESHPDAAGRELSEGIVPKEVLPTAKKVQREVIVLDDEDEI